MRVYGVVGWKNAGKTGLMERLVTEITGRGFSVSTVKHCLLYTSPSPRDLSTSRMPSSA